MKFAIEKIGSNNEEKVVSSKMNVNKRLVLMFSTFDNKIYNVAALLPPFYIIYPLIERMFS